MSRKFKKLSFVVLLFTVFISPITSAADLDEMIGQMIMIGFRGTELENAPILQKDILNKRVGGVVLYDIDREAIINYVAKVNAAADKEHQTTVVVERQKPRIDENGKIKFERNIQNPDQLLKLTSDLQLASEKAMGLPLLIAMDREGGIVNRLSPFLGFPQTVSQKALVSKTPEEVATIAAEYVQTLKQYGVNYVLAPDVDLEINPDNPVIAKLERSFSRDAGVVSMYAKILIDAYNQNHIACALKHFPGHGSSTTDTHEGFTDVTKTWVQTELDPYSALLQKSNIGVTVMPAHIVNTHLDSHAYPASLSKRMMHILRKEIGFKGIVISDDMQMGAIAKNYAFDDAIRLAIEAGNDILIFGNQITYDPIVAIHVKYAIKQMVANGIISENRIRKSYNKIIQLKQWIGSAEQKPNA